MCEYCEGVKPVYENNVCFLAGSIRFIHIVKQKFGHYLSISTWGKLGKNQKFIKIQYCPMCGRKLNKQPPAMAKENKDA